MVSTLRPSGEINRAPAGAFGAITNAHHIRFGGPFDSSFEPMFQQADAELKYFVQWLLALDTSFAAPNKPMVERITPQTLDPERQRQLSRTAASLLARSPVIRDTIRRTTESYRERFGLADRSANKNLIAANQEGLYDAYRKRMENSGRWAILFSDEREFIAGDGFLHNLPASRDGINSGLKLVLPILPTATIIYMLPSSYPSEPRLVTLRVSADEVLMLNDIVQVYARDFLFFRDEPPDLIDAFKMGEHRQLQYHGHDWLDGMLDDLSQFNLWGEDRSAGIGSNRPYTESLEGNRWLEQFCDS